MKILVACEESQRVCIAFRNKGHEAFSCDILECSGEHPEWHIKGDCTGIINGSCTFRTQDGEDHTIQKRWDMIIAHPPCTDLAVSGARWFEEKKKNGSQQKSIEFFMMFVKADCQKIAIENPIGIMSTIYKKPNQIIQPWQFGHGEVKSTCLWLKGLPNLTPTKIVEGRTPKCWRMPPSPERGKLRSKTYEGIAQAMAEQWG